MTLRPRGLAALFVVSLALAGAGCSPTSPTVEGPKAPRITGWLHTAGTRIVDAAGRPVRFQGIDIASMARGVGSPGDAGLALTGCRGWDVPPPSLLRDVATWGFNSVRLAISWANLEPNPPTAGPTGPEHHYDQAYLSAIDGVVETLGAEGVAVIVEMAQAQWSPAFTNVPTFHGPKCAGVGMPRWLYPNPGSITQTQARLDFFADRDGVQQGYLDAWTQIAGRYADDPTVVAFDLFNEPYTQGGFVPSRMHLGAFYGRIGVTIRAVNPRALMIFQDSNYSPDGTYALSAAPAFPGAVYELHLYVGSWATQGLPRLEAYWRRASAWNVPLYVGEYDAFGYSSPFAFAPTWRSDLSSMFAYCDARSIGWNLFTASPGWFLEPGGSEPKPNLLPALQEDFTPPSPAPAASPGSPSP